MVQKSRTQSPSIISVFGTAFLRVILLCVVVFIAGYTAPTALDILKNYLGYQTPSGFFWGGNLSDGITALEFALVFWSSIIFGVIGRWWDYLLIAAIFGWSLYSDIYSGVTPLVIIGLIAAAILGNAIGFVLKLLRQKFLPTFNL